MAPETAIHYSAADFMLAAEMHMPRYLSAFVTAIFLDTMVHAQDPQLTSIFPPGGQRGTTVEVVIDGKDLKDAHKLVFSHPQVSATKVASKLPGVRFALTLPDAETEFDVYAVTPTGLSNPRRFVVGALAEVNEKEKNDDAKTAQAVKLPLVINGMLEPGTERDYYRFELAANQQFTLHFRSETLDGTARPALTLYGPSGKELLHDDGRDAEPALNFTAPEAGEYLLKVEERAYQKGDYNVYRLSLCTAPYLVGAYPQLLTRGKEQTVTLYGYRLPGGKSHPSGLEQAQVTINAPQVGDPDGGGWSPGNSAYFDAFRYRHPGVLGEVRFGLAEGDVLTDGGMHHDSEKQAQPLAVPAVVAGRFLRPRQIDWYRVTAKKDQKVWLEGVGERDGKVMDLEINIHDAKGKVLKTIGDFALAKGETTPIPMATFDPMELWSVPADGDYFVIVRDLFGPTQWGVTRTYRLMLLPRREEVRVLALPTGTTPRGLGVMPGGSATVQLIALRRHGHQEPIRVRAETLPPGLEVKEVVIGPKDQMATLTIAAAKDAAAWTGKLSLLAQTDIERKTQKMPVLGLTTVRGPSLRRCDGIVAAIVSK